MKKATFTILVCAVFLVFAAPVFAQTAPPAKQDLFHLSDGGPVTVVQSPPVTVSAGSIGADVLTWLAAVFVPVLGAFGTALLRKLAAKAGVDLSQAASDRLDDMIENGLHSAAAAASTKLDGTMTVEVKNQVLAQAVTYAQQHGADTIKTLGGVDPNDPKVIAALQARATKALDNLIPSAAPAAPQA